MKSKTSVVTLAMPGWRVFNYLSRIENLPRWATEFCRELKQVGNRHKILTCPAAGGQELFFEIHADDQTGVIDMYFGPSEDRMTVFPSRVVELPDGTSAFVFTMFQSPEIDDERFEIQYQSLEREFQNIKSELSGTVCRREIDTGGAAMTIAENVNLEERLQRLISYIEQGRILEAMNEFYAEDVRMQENSNPPTVGLKANVERERQFLDTVKEWKTFEIKGYGVGKNMTFYECVCEWIATDDQPVHLEEAVVAAWCDGKIVHERFFYDPAGLTKV